ncbi:hypothetical protein ACHL6L_39705 [Amycolatopsis sp. A24]|uniref:Uncharacterized protein n=1 Tax=Amycolatopsis bullii TaxID=941987 RepID=A0ABQ3KQV3_9PSEU|nr:hypothetical protein GCM10017567_79260 [Amycolatopsis bullii]
MPTVYNAFAFPTKLSAAEMADLNRVVAAESFGNSGPDDTALAWMRAHGSFDVGAIRATVVVQAIDQPVRVVGVKALVEKKSAPLSATILYTPPDGSDEVEKADLDLDAQHPAAPVFAQKTISLQPGESTVLDVRASATRFAVVWRIGVDVVADGLAQTVTIGNLDSGPFRTTGLPDRRPKVSGTRGDYVRLYPDPWWFRGSFETPDEKAVYVAGPPPA